MLGSMGLACPIALGVALAQPGRRVFALEGDGSLLMQLGCLTTIATQAPENLTLIVMDNGIYQITGGQPTPGATTSDIVAVAQGCGLANASWAADEDDFERLIEQSLIATAPTLIAARIDDKPGTGTTRRDPVQIQAALYGGVRRAAGDLRALNHVRRDLLDRRPLPGVIAGTTRCDSNPEANTARPGSARTSSSQ